MTAKPPGRVKLKKKHTPSSQQWLTRQLNDPYVHAAKREGWRSRAAFKLIELDKKFHFLRKGARVLDLGSAPGGWSQVAAKSGAVVAAADVLEMEPIPGVTFFQADLMSPPPTRRKRSSANCKPRASRPAPSRPIRLRRPKSTNW